MTARGNSSEILDAQVLDLLLAEDGVASGPAGGISRRGPGADAPLSFAQRRMWILHQADPRSAAYNVCAAVRLRGRLSRPALLHALRAILRRHEVLRTSFDASAGEVRPRVHAQVQLDLPFVDLGALPAPGAARAVRRCTARFVQMPFDLGTPPLLRAILLRLCDDDHVAVLCLHHIAADGWSMQVLVRELGEIYAARLDARKHTLPELPIQYGDFSAWQHGWLAGQRLEADLGYWRQRLAGLPSLDLPCDRPSPGAPTHAGASVAFRIDPGTRAALEALARAEGATLFMTLLAAFQALLSRLTGQQDVAVGTVVANRNRRELEPLIGFFVNTLVMRADLTGRPTFRTLLARVRDAALGAYEHQELPFELIVRELAPERERGRHPLFRVMFTVDDTATAPLALPGVTLEPVAIQTRVAKFDLMLGMARHGDALAGAFEYACERFDAPTIERWASHFEHLLCALAEDPDRPVSRLPLLGTHARAVLLGSGNDTAAPYPRDSGLGALFAAQAARTPDAPALEFGGERLSYRELEGRANRLAGYLLARGVGPETPVGLCLGQGSTLIVAMLAVIQAGGAYVPLHPEYPRPRLSFIIEDTAIGIVLTAAPWAGALPPGAFRVVRLDTSEAAIAGADPPAATPAIGGSHLAYVLYTSGSTGRPKGIAIPHRAVARLVLATDYITLGPGDRVAQASNFAFDAITFEVWGALLNGACLVGIDRETTLAPERLASGLREARISALFLTTALFNQAARLAPTAFATVRDLLVGGEALDPGCVGRVLDARPPERLRNAYGPTETTTFATSHLIDRAAAQAASVPIGRPIANTLAYVLDPWLEPVPLGVEGELYIGGDGLARGYVGRSAQTAERFVPDPFATGLGARLYRTGDRARRRADGAIEFLGRVDAQVKMRGLRIEPGEIEAALGRHPDVSAALVTLRSDLPGGSALVAYVAPGGGAAPAPRALREHLREELPAFMVPAYYVVLDGFPVTANGKIDRAALPAPAAPLEPAGEQAGGDPPTNDVERALVKVYREVLHRDRVGIHDSYFELGGDSIMAIQVVSRLRGGGWPVELGDLFAAPSIAALAGRIGTAGNASGAARGDASDAVEEPASGASGFSAVQRWFFESHRGTLSHFNQSLLLRARERVDAGALQAALAAVHARHDALRLVFPGAADGVRAACANANLAPAFEVVVLDAPGAAPANLEAHADAVQRGLSLARGPLLQTVLYRLPDGDRVLLVAHHLVVDGVSWRILLQDLEQAYEQLTRGTLHGTFVGHAPTPGPPSASFRRWTRAANAFASSTELRAELAYWQAVERGMAVPAPARPGLLRHGDARVVQITLPPALTTVLTSTANRAYRTQVNDLLLTGLGRALVRWGSAGSGTRITHVTLEGHGREAFPGSPDVSRTVGWFTSLFPLDVALPGDDLAYQIKSMKERLRGVPRKGIGYGLLRYLAPPEVRAGLCAPPPLLAFNYLGRFDDESDAGRRFAFDDLAHGRAIDPDLLRAQPLDVVGLLAGGRLELSLTYDPGHTTDTGARALLDGLADEVERVAEHCERIARPECTPADFTTLAFSLDAYDAFLQARGWPASAVEDVHALSPMQSGLLFQSLFDPQGHAYFVQLSSRITGPFDGAAFARGWSALTARHEALRSVIVHAGIPAPLQVVFRHHPPDIRQRTLPQGPRQDEDAAIEALLRNDREEGFELERRPPVRVTLVALGDERHLLVWSYHHLLLDGWCLGVLLGDLGRILAAERRGEAPALPAIAPYGDYIHWLQARDHPRDRAFWADHLAGCVGITGIAPDRIRAHAPDAGPQEARFAFGRECSDALRALAAAAGVTLNTVLQCLWALLLARHNRTDDVVLGVIVSGRPSELPGVETMVGLFINAVPVRIALPAGSLFTAVLRETQAAAVRAEPHHHVPLAEIQTLGPSGRELFDHLFIFENYPVDELSGQAEELSGPGLRVEAAGAHDHTHYPLNVVVVPGDDITLRVTFDGGRYSRRGIEQLVGQLRCAAHAAVSDPHRRVRDLTLLSTHERARILAHGRGGSAPARNPATVMDQFRARVASAPHATALVCGSVRLSYAALDEQVRRIAAALRARLAPAPDERIGVLLDRSPWLVASVLGILDAGAAYVPVDPDYPAERIAYILDDSGCRSVLSEPAHIRRFAARGANWIDVHGLGHGAPAGGMAPAATHPGRAALAYVIYTSGSTGRPKGCAVTHANLHHYLGWASGHYFDGPGGGSFPLFTSIAFDLTVTSLFLPLIRGKTLHVLAQEMEPAIALERIFEPGSGIDSVKLTPSHVALLRETAVGETALGLAILGGEALPEEHVRYLHRLNPRMAVYNEYGPTETTVGCVIRRAEPGDIAVPIGRPITDTRAYVLDARLAPVPAGVPGELYVGGAGVTRGYLGRRALTAERFVPDPHRDGERMYATGDLARWRPDGELDFLGRADTQLSVRGQRIEPGEIEHALRAQPGVAEAAVAMKALTGGTQALVAYVTGSEPDPDPRLRGALTRCLPAHLVPWRIVAVDALPLTPNGKVDRAALPLPAVLEGAPEPAPPRDRIEARLLEHWQTLLGAPTLGIHDDFFSRGGHSLTAMQAVARIHLDLGVRLPLRIFFANPTVAAIAERVRSAPASELSGIEPVVASASYPLSHAQIRLWLEHRMQSGVAAYNMPHAVEVEGPLDAEALTRALASLVERHEALRTGFVEIDGEPRQVLHEHVEPVLARIDLVGDANPADRARALAEADAARAFALDAPPLLRATLMRLGHERHVFVLTVHHIIGDGWSLGVLYRELAAFYEAHRRDRPAALPALRIQYKDYAAWQRGQRFEHEARYWRRQLEGVPPGVRLPPDHAPGEQRSYRGDIVRRTLSQDTTRALRATARRGGTTLSSTVLTLFVLLLFRLTRQDDLCVGVGVANRDHPDIEGLIGFFVNILPLRVQVSDDMGFDDLLARVAGATEAALEHQSYPFDLLVEHLNPQRAARGQPVVNVVYAFQSASDAYGALAADASPGAGSRSEGEGMRHASPFPVACRTSKFDLTLFVVEAGNALALIMEYDTDLFAATTIESHIDNLARFAGVLANPSGGSMRAEA